MTLGSLFDGSGGFPLAGQMNGITPIWAAEVEPYPIAVTRSRFPQMMHLGSVTEVHGDKVQPVDVITFGSPCQDLSVAGKRAGIHDGQRSNLFFEAIRIIREMREATDGVYPAFAVLENVPGAFSSNQGEDFRCVLEEFVRVSAEISVPRPAGGRWPQSGEIVGDGYSVAWRQLDAQYWGVPQRRKRIYLVADFAGGRAGEILFERESLRGHPAPGEAKGQGTATDAPGGTGGSRGIECLNPRDCQSKRIYQPDGICPTLPAMDCGGANNQAVLYALDSMSSNSMKSSNPHSGFHEETVAKTLQAGGVDPKCNQGGNVIVEPGYALQGNGIDRAETAGCNGRGWRENVCYTLNTIDRHAVCYQDTVGALCAADWRGHNSQYVGADKLICTDARGNGNGQVCANITGDHENRVTDYTNIITYGGDKAGTLDASYYKGAGARNGKEREFVAERKAGRKYIVRRLTPLECCRLQGFPDGWGIPDHKDKLSDEELAFWQQVRDTCAAISGKPSKEYSAEALTKWYNSMHTDSAEYKMWGNGIAIPCAAFVLEGIAEKLEGK